MIQAFLQIRNFIFQTFDQPFGDFTQENPGFAAGIQERGFRISEKFPRELIQHFIGNFRRGENFIVAQVSQTLKHIRLVNRVEKSAGRINSGIGGFNIFHQFPPDCAIFK